MFVGHKERLKSGLSDDHAGGFLSGKQTWVCSTGIMEWHTSLGSSLHTPHSPKTHLTQGSLLHPAFHLTEVKLTFCTRLITENKLVLGVVSEKTGSIIRSLIMTPSEI